jgi:MFS family permease
MTRVLVACLLLMGFSTFAVGLLPTYEQVGLLAPALLVLLRLIQGFAVAGEISGASSMVLEHAPFGRRGFFASFTLQGVQAGQILAAAVFLPLAAYMPAEDFARWGWRVPFLLSVLVIAAGYIIRREVAETPVFAAADRGGALSKRPAIQAISESWADMLRVIGMALMNVIPVVTTVFGAAYAVQPGYGIGFASAVYLWIPVLGNLLAVLVIPFVGDLSDRIGRRYLIPYAISVEKLRPCRTPASRYPLLPSGGLNSPVPVSAGLEKTPLSTCAGFHLEENTPQRFSSPVCASNSPKTR